MKKKKNEKNEMYFNINKQRKIKITKKYKFFRNGKNIIFQTIITINKSIILKYIGCLNVMQENIKLIKIHFVDVTLLVIWNW